MSDEIAEVPTTVVLSSAPAAPPRARQVGLIALVIASAVLGAAGGYVARRPPIPETRFTNFDAESAPTDVLAEGWSTFETTPPGDGFVWCKQKSCMLRISVNQPSERVIRVRLFPFVYPGAPPQTVIVSINGEQVTRAPVPDGPSVLVFGVDTHFLRPRTNQLRFDFAYAESPKDHVPGSTDDRKLAAAFDWLEVVTR